MILGQATHPPPMPAERPPEGPPMGVVLPLCWCRDVYKCVKSTDEWTIGQRYWCCPNYGADYSDRRFDTQSHKQLSPSRLCDFSQWIDDKIHLYDMWWLLTQKSWVREDNEARERYLKELQAEKDEQSRRDKLREEQERGHARRRETERKPKRAITARGKAQGDEYNVELDRKGKWPHSMRGYYRCTHRNSQGCVATKQVQRTDEDPALFNVIYHGTHTCVQKAVAGQAAAAGKNQPLQNPDAHSLLQSMSSSLTVKTEGLATEPRDWSTMPFCFSSPVTGLASEHNPFSTPSTPEIFAPGVSLSPSLVSPATSDSNHLSMAPFHVAGDAEWCAQSELQEVVSALVAVTSTPVPAMETDFSVDGFEFDPSFTIDVSSFFP